MSRQSQKGFGILVPWMHLHPPQFAETLQKLVPSQVKILLFLLEQVYLPREPHISPGMSPGAAGRIEAAMAMTGSSFMVAICTVGRKLEAEYCAMLFGWLSLYLYPR